MSELTELERQQIIHIQELETRLAVAQGELADYAKTVTKLRDELERAKQRIKELMEIYQ